ncbi:MAG: SDR family NAD(P)-dependent oxidoreductase, partial [Acetobacteraceae bacterium]|nr:SDR family NAD(P)-dependent oxidoreductase [Acetobacteraceae bacterium]
VPEEEFRRVIEVNLLGTVNGTRIALRRMLPRNRGTVVQVLSAISFRGVPLQSAYSASKFGLRGFTEAVRSELRHDRSRVHLTMVHPPATNTPFYSHAGSVMEKAPRPPPPVYQPEMVGEALFLAGTVKRRDWVIGGQSAALKLSNQLAPGMVDLLMGAVGVATQQTTREEVLESRRPRPPEAKTHGPFDWESLSHSVHWLATKNPATTGLALGVAALGLASALRRNSD